MNFVLDYPVHKHENTSLVMIVLSGSGQIQINKETENTTNQLYSKEIG